MGLSTVCDGWNGTASAESAESCCSKATASKVSYNRLVMPVSTALDTKSDKQTCIDSILHTCGVILHKSTTKLHKLSSHDIYCCLLSVTRCPFTIQ